MNRILVVIALSAESLEKIKLNPELQQAEMQFIQQWKQEGVLESFFISVSKTGAVLIFTNLNESQTQERIEQLPYFPFMAKVDYHNLDKQF